MATTFAGRKILLVEDEEEIRGIYARYFTSVGFLVEETADCATAYKSFAAIRPDIAVLDFQLPDGTALELLPKLKALEPEVPIIILTGYGSMELGIQLIQSGAEQCLAKPLKPAELLLIVDKVLRHSRNQQKSEVANTQRRRVTRDPFLGLSDTIHRLQDTAWKVAKGHSPVLIQGETGSGKGVLAHWLHENGPRADEPFVDLNCAGLSREFLEPELFGYEKGAFTGAVNAKQGLLEVAHRGTMFLDEVGDVDANVQPKLLKVVEEKRFRRMGDVRDRFVDVRLIAATHQDLRQMIEGKTFRSDLYFRISTVPLVIPPLRERREDIPFIVESLLHNICNDMARPMPEISQAALKELSSYSWPGNIRELRNVLERTLLLEDKHALQPQDFHFEATAAKGNSNYDPNWTLEQLEAFHIKHVFDELGGNVEQTAKRLGMAKSTLYQRLKTMKLG